MTDLTKLTAERLERLCDENVPWPSTIRAEIRRRLERLEKCEAMRLDQRAKIVECLKGNTFSQNQWVKGYCAGIMAALTAFDDADLTPRGPK